MQLFSSFLVLCGFMRLAVENGGQHFEFVVTSMDPQEFFKNNENDLCQVYKKFGKNKNDVEEDIEIVKTWLQMQPHLPEMMQDVLIRNFLILNKFSIEKTKKKIDAYYTIRSSIPEFYDHANPKLPEMKKNSENYNLCAFPKLLGGLNRIIFLKFLKPDTLSPPHVAMAACNLAEIRLHEDCFFDHIPIIDLKNLTFGDITKLTPSLIKKVMTLQEVYSFSFKIAYVINAPKFISKTADLVKMFMKPKLFNRIRISDNDDILKEIFPIDELPEDYGGNGSSIQELTDVLKVKIDEYQERFDKLDEMRVDNSLRPSPLTNDELLGFYGNFKKINID